MKKVLKIEGMHCKSCAILINSELEDIGVKSNIDYKSGKAEIEFDEDKISENQIKDAIKKEGYKVV